MVCQISVSIFPKDRTTFGWLCMCVYTHTHTHTHIYILYITEQVFHIEPLPDIIGFIRHTILMTMPDRILSREDNMNKWKNIEKMDN